MHQQSTERQDAEGRSRGLGNGEVNNGANNINIAVTDDFKTLIARTTKAIWKMIQPQLIRRTIAALIVDPHERWKSTVGCLDNEIA